jgi:hypothetical protein
MLGCDLDSAGASGARNSSMWRRAGNAKVSWILVKHWGGWEGERERGREGGSVGR